MALCGLEHRQKNNKSFSRAPKGIRPRTPTAYHADADIDYTARFFCRRQAKKTPMVANQITRELTRYFGQPLGGFDFPPGYPWLVENNIPAKKISLIPNWRGRRCAFPLKCGRIAQTAAGEFMAMGALEPSSNITEQAARCQWLLFTMSQHTSSRRVPPPSVPCDMPSWAIACRVWHCAAPWHALRMRIPYTYEQGSCNLTCTYTRLQRSTEYYPKPNC